MPPTQPNALSFNPNSLKLVQIATYDRLVHASLVRVWENVLDWAHLPYLHETSFDYVELDTAGEWGWRTWSSEDHQDHVELTLATEDSYVARSYRGGQQVSEIWTTLTAAGIHTQVRVEFYLPDIDRDHIKTPGDIMTGLYTRLWDEDEAMMQQRHQRLHEARNDCTEQLLGSEADIRDRLKSGEALTFQLKRREYTVTEMDGRLVAFSSICPHLLGPLSAPISKGQVRCPWHGYRFDIRTGKCVFPAHANCELPPPPELSISNGNLIARLS